MAKQRIAVISANTVGRHRIIGRDRDGKNIEEKVCPLKSEKFIDCDGIMIDLALENGRIRSPEGERYGQMHREEYIKEARGLPVAECPYTERYRHLVHGPLVAPPDDVKSCQGAPDGCEHLKFEIGRRAADAKDRANVRKKALRAGDDAAQQVGLAMAKSIQAFAESQNATAPSVHDSRRKMVAGKGEAV
jgi:hypothetical protein